MRHRLTRREALASGVVGLASGAAMLTPHAAKAATGTSDGVPADSASTAPGGNVDTTRYNHLLRDTADAPWRAKVVPGTAQEKFYENVYRIDPDNPLPPGEPDADYAPVITPNNHTLRYEVRDGVKVFHLVAEEVTHHFDPGLRCFTWGYNGITNGPTIEAVEGDRIRIYVTNKLPTRRPPSTGTASSSPTAWTASRASNSPPSSPAKPSSTNGPSDSSARSCTTPTTTP